MRQIFPRAPQAVLDAFVAKQSVLDAAGITHTRTRLTYFFANIEHESDGFTIPNLTENTRYTAERMVQVWPNRFPSAAAVRAKYGAADGWQLKAFDDIYGNRMGNRPGSHDGSTYIGRGEARRWSHGCEEEKPSMNDTATTEQPTAPAADVDWEWTIVEIFGHRRHVGKAREEEKFGTKLLRIGVPKLGPGPGEIMWSGHFYGGPVRTVVWEGRSCETPSYPDSRFRGVRFPEFTS
jgi:hypothetical protein